MRIVLDNQTRTTPAVRAEIAETQESIRELARRYNVTEATIRKGKLRMEFKQQSHTVRRAQRRLTPLKARSWFTCVQPSCCFWMTCSWSTGNV